MKQEYKRYVNHRQISLEKLKDFETVILIYVLQML